MNVREYKTVKERHEALEKNLGVALPSIGSAYASEDIASARNCENMIGIAQVPLGIAGPLKIISSSLHPPAGGPVSSLDYYVPLATTEGALVASVNRGCKAISESGGAKVRCEKTGTTRGPVFRVHDLSDGEKLRVFLVDHKKELQKIAQNTSGHLVFLDMNVRAVGRYVFVRFSFDTKDAMGMNMATIATEKMCDYITLKSGATCISVAGNYDIDKKPAWLNFIDTRGMKAWAEVVISGEVLKNVLKTDAQKMCEVWLSKCMIGSAMAGSLGFNAQYANVVAGIFLATGQDIAHVGEASMGITTCEVVSHSNPKSQIPNPKNDLYISVYLPDLMVGTVGGGTGLATQKEALTLLGVDGGDDGKNSVRLAEIIAGAVLAGEVSLLASLSVGTLARSHKSLARGESI